MITRYNVSIQMTEEELKMLSDLNEVLSNRSIKEVNRTETVKYACKFTSKNLDVMKLVKELENEVSTLKEDNEVLREAILEFYLQVKKATAKLK